MLRIKPPSYYGAVVPERQAVSAASGYRDHIAQTVRYAPSAPPCEHSSITPKRQVLRPPPRGNRDHITYADRDCRVCCTQAALSHRASLVESNKASIGDPWGRNRDNIA